MTWNNCPICNNEMRLFVDDSGFLSKNIYCANDDVHYYVDFDHSNEQLYLESIKIGEFLIRRRINQFIVYNRDFISLVNIQEQIPFDKINTEVKIKRLLMLT